MKAITFVIALLMTTPVFANYTPLSRAYDLYSSDTSIYIVSDERVYKVKHDCDLPIHPDAKVVVKAKRVITLDSHLRIKVDGRRLYCKVKSVETARR